MKRNAETSDDITIETDVANPARKKHSVRHEKESRKRTFGNVIGVFDHNGHDKTAQRTVCNHAPHKRSVPITTSYTTHSGGEREEEASGGVERYP